MFMMPKAKKEDVDLLLRYYPDDPMVGCPFDTGLRNMYSMFNVIVNSPLVGLNWDYVY
jgi:hypothetical protein